MPDVPVRLPANFERRNMRQKTFITIIILLVLLPVGCVSIEGNGWKYQSVFKDIEANPVDITLDPNGVTRFKIGKLKSESEAAEIIEATVNAVVAGTRSGK